MVMVGQADNGREAVDKVLELKPDVVLMDVVMKEMCGMEATSQIKKDLPDVKIIAVSGHKDERLIREMIKVGADGYVIKDSDDESMIKRFEELTPKEQEVLMLQAEGMSAKEIGVKMGITDRAVNKHRESIIQKISRVDYFKLIKCVAGQDLECKIHQKS